MPSRRLAFLGGVVCGAAAADAPLDPGAVRQALATVALGAFVLGACCACACAAACWCASIAYDADGGGGGPFSARRVLAALGAKEPPRRYARVRLNDVRCPTTPSRPRAGGTRRSGDASHRSASVRRRSASGSALRTMQTTPRSSRATAS